MYLITSDYFSSKQLPQITMGGGGGHKWLVTPKYLSTGGGGGGHVTPLGSAPAALSRYVNYMGHVAYSKAGSWMVWKFIYKYLVLFQH